MQLIPKATSPESALFAPSHRPEREIAGPTSQRFRDLPHQEKIRRAREEEAPGFPVAIDGALDCAEQFWCTLHLVKCYRTGAAYQHLWIALGSVEHVEIVKRCIATGAGDQLFGQSTLTGLARTCHHDRRHNAQAFGKSGPNQPGKGLHTVNDSHSRRE